MFLFILGIIVALAGIGIVVYGSVTHDGPVSVVGVVALIVAIALIAATRYVSLGSITLASLFAVLVIASNWANWLVILWVLIIAGLLIWRHHANIGRLLHGTENKLGSKKK